jgi:hypothetical protein
MVNFNIGEFRGFHGRWAPGGPHHPHLRRRKGIFGRAVGAAEAGARDATRTERVSAGSVARARRTSDAQIRNTAERMARAQGISSSEMRQAERSAGVSGGGGAERSASEQARRDETRARKTSSTRSRSMGRRRYHPLLRHALYGGGRHGPGSLLRNALLARSLYHALHRQPPKPKKPKKAPVKKAPKKAAPKKAAAKRPVTIRPPKAPTGKRPPGGKGAGSGVAQKVTPSAQVMANLQRYTNVPGGVRAGVGTAGRSSMSSTGRTAGARVGSGRSSVGIRAPSSARMRTHG